MTKRLAKQVEGHRGATALPQTPEEVREARAQLARWVGHLLAVDWLRQAESPEGPPDEEKDAGT